MPCLLRTIGLTFLLAAAGSQAREPIVGLPCEGCEAVFVGLPADLSPRSRIAPVDEPGEPMVVSGHVHGPDGKARSGVVVYAYQTDAGGIYPSPRESRSEASDRHGRLRGWAITDANGRYVFDTIRPASYPTRDVPAHIHMHVIEPGCSTYYIDDIMFTDDPLLTPGQIDAHSHGRGGSGITTPVRSDGQWHVERDIRLGSGIPGHPGCDGKR